MVLWLLGISSVVAAAAAPTPVPCVTTTRPASKSQRYLVFASGHVRSLAATAETLHRRVVVPTRPAAVDVVYSVWHDAGYSCEERILQDVQTRYNFTIYHDPRQCDHARNTNFHGGSNQWDAIRRALGAALATHGDDYGLILKARTDLSFSQDVDLKEYQRRFAKEPAVQRANGNWLMVSACLQGADIFMLGTPALILQHFRGAKSHSSDGGNLEFRLTEHGIAPTEWGRLGKLAEPNCRGDVNLNDLMVRLYNGSTFRCAPLFAENIGRSHLDRANPCSPIAERSVLDLRHGVAYCHSDFGATYKGIMPRTNYAKKRFEETEPRLTCPAAKPRCAGFVRNERWGECRGRRLESGGNEHLTIHGAISAASRRRAAAATAYDPERPRKWNRESIDINMTAACRDQCAAVLSRPPRRFGSNQQTLVNCHAAHEVPNPSLIRNHLIQRRPDPSTSLPRHPDAAFGALEDKFRNRGTPPPAALARIAELEARKNNGGG